MRSLARHAATLGLFCFITQLATAQPAVRDSIPVDFVFVNWRSWSGGLYRNCGTRVVGVHDDPIGRGIGSGGYSYTEPSNGSDAGEGAPPDIKGVQITYFASYGSGSAPGYWPDCGAIASRLRAAWAGREVWAVFSLTEERPIAKFTWEAEGLDVQLDGTPSHVATAQGRRPVSSYSWSVGGSAGTIAHSFNSPGEYEVSLTVTDGEGNEDTYSDTVTVTTEQLTLRSVPLEPGAHYAKDDTVVVETTLENTGEGPVRDVVLPPFTEALGKMDAPEGAFVRRAAMVRLSTREPETRAMLGVGEHITVLDSFFVKEEGTYKLDGEWFTVETEAWAEVHGEIEASSDSGDPVQVLRPCDDAGCEIWIVGPPDNSFVVNDDRDLPDLDVGDGRCDAVDDSEESGNQCTLRAAIETANQESILDIGFDIEGIGPHTIAITEPLPEIEVGTIIDGTTQPGYTDRPMIIIDGSGGPADGLVIDAGGATVRGLSVVGFSGAGIKITGEGGNSIEACYLGVDPDGSTLRANGYGVLVEDSPDNTIGGATAAARNLVGVSTTGGGGGLQEEPAGILVRGNATGNVVAGNWVGLRATGDAALTGGRNGIGIFVIGGPETVVGGAAATPGQAPGNVVGGVDYGIAVTSTSVFESKRVQIDGNLVGTDVTGTRAVANEIGIGVVGAVFEAGIGEGGGNVVSGNATTGIVVSSATAADGGEGQGFPVLTKIVGNLIGLTADGQGVLGNGVGVFVFGEEPIPAPVSTLVGASGQPRNIISGNQIQVLVAGGAHPVYSDPSATDDAINQTFTFIENNYIGLLADGTLADAGNGGGTPYGIGVLVVGDARARIGFVGARNVIGGQEVGIRLESAGNVVPSNYIGTDPTGMEARPNGIGLATAGGFVTIGVQPPSGGGGSFPFPADEGNLISGNREVGVLVNPAVLVESNRQVRSDVGARAGELATEAPLPPDSTQAADTAQSTRAQSADLPDVTALFYNRIGLAADGSTLPNGAGYAGSDPVDEAGGGLRVVLSKAFVAYNVISGNSGDGIAAYGAGAEIYLAGNVIGGGFAADFPPRPNTRDGVYTRAAKVVLGALPASIGLEDDPGIDWDVPSHIWYNGRHGIGTAFGNDQVIVEQTSLHRNGDLGIALGLITNEESLEMPDPFTPSLTENTATGTATLRLTGQNPTPTTITNYTMQIGVFLSEECDPSGYGEGQTGLTTLPVGTDEFYVFELETDKSTVPVGSYVTLIATQITVDGRFQSSEFTQCVRVATDEDVVDGPINAPGDELVGPGIVATVTAVGEGSQIGKGAVDGGRLYAARHNLAPDPSAFEGSAFTPDGTTVTPDTVGARYWTLASDALTGATYDVCLDATGLFPDHPASSHVITRRDRARATWSPLNTTLSDAGWLCATGLTAFGDLAIGAHVGRVDTGTDDPSTLLPTETALSAYPNPTNGRVTVEIVLPVNDDVHAEVFDLLGRHVALLVDGPLPAGNNSLQLDLVGLPAGLYLVRATTSSGSFTRRLTVVK